MSDDNLSKAELALIDRIIGSLGLSRFKDLLWSKVESAFNFTFHHTQVSYGFAHATPDERALKYLEERVFILSDRTQSRLTGDLRWELLEGMRNTESIDEIKRRLDTVFAGSDVNTERIARTETLNAMAEGRFQANVESGVALYKMWRAAMNNPRTAADSKRLHGQIQKIEDPFVDPKTGDECMHNPNRPNCRCTVIYLRKLPATVMKNGMMYAVDEVQKLEIDIGSLTKAEKRVWVKATAKRKGHYRRIKDANAAEPEKKSVEKTITDYEMTIRDQDYESCGVVDPNGNLIFTKSGESDNIQFTKDEKDIFKGTVSTHNHPIGNSFSDADIRWACISEMKEMRVITSAGMSFTMKRRDGANFSEDLWKSRISPNYSMVNNEVHDEFGAKIFDGRMTIEEANSKHWDEVWARVVRHIPELEYIAINR